MNSVLELDGFFTDLLPSAAAISVIANNPTEFTDCNSNENRTQVRFATDGVAEFSDENLLTQEEIQQMVTVAKVKAYLGGERTICKERDVFDATVSDANSKSQLGIDGGWAQLYCDINYSEFVTKSIQTAAIVSVVVAVVICLCIICCICACCGVCG
jgi:hypothetical protein